MSQEDIQSWKISLGFQMLGLFVPFQSDSVLSDPLQERKQLIEFEFQ